MELQQFDGKEAERAVSADDRARKMIVVAELEKNHSYGGDLVEAKITCPLVEGRGQENKVFFIELQTLFEETTP